MRRKRALFVSLNALQSSDGGSLDAATLGLLRDHAACGSCVIVVSDNLEMNGRTYENAAELLRAIHRECGSRHSVPVAGLCILDNAFDPAPFWDAARRFGLSLPDSIFVSRLGEYAGAAKTAGVIRTESRKGAFGVAA